MNTGDKIAEADIAAYDLAGVSAYAPETRSDTSGIPRHLLTAAVLNGEVWLAAELGGDVDDVVKVAKTMGQAVICNGDDVPFVRATFLEGLFEAFDLPKVVKAIQESKERLLAHHVGQLN